MRIGLEDDTRPRPVTRAGMLVVIQTVLWIFGLVLLQLSLVNATRRQLSEPLEGWILPMRSLIWYLLSWRFAEALAIIALAVAMMKRQNWARRALEATVLVRGLLPVPEALALFALGPMIWKRQDGNSLAFTALPLLLLTFPMPILLFLLEKSASRAWFRGGGRLSAEPDDGEAPPPRGPDSAARPVPSGGWIHGWRHALISMAVAAALITGWLHWRWSPLGDPLRVGTAQMEREPKGPVDLPPSAVPRFYWLVLELENTGSRSLAVPGADYVFLTLGDARPPRRMGSSSARLVGPGQRLPLKENLSLDSSYQTGVHFLALRVCYADKWDYYAHTTQVFVWRLSALEEGGDHPDLQLASEEEATEARAQAFEYASLRKPDPNARCD